MNSAPANISFPKMVLFIVLLFTAPVLLVIPSSNISIGVATAYFIFMVGFLNAQVVLLSLVMLPLCLFGSTINFGAIVNFGIIAAIYLIQLAIYGILFWKSSLTICSLAYRHIPNMKKRMICLSVLVIVLLIISALPIYRIPESDISDGANLFNLITLPIRSCGHQ